MSAADPLKQGQRRLFRTLAPPETPPGGTASASRRRASGLKCSYRAPGSDFYCWKYGVWYNLMDCCFRHAFRTYSGCSGCGQGRMNLRQHFDRFTSARHLGQRVTRPR
jgi:hypothetical protein